MRTALSDTRIVAVMGPRQSGKTTLVRRIARNANLPYVRLDEAPSRRFAPDEPIGFVRGFPAATIAELQRARNASSPSSVQPMKTRAGDASS